MTSKLYSLLKFLIGWPLSLLALFFIGKLIAPQAPQLLSNLHAVSLPLVCYGIISFLIYYFIRGYIWKRLSELIGHEISFKDATFIWGSSELKRYIPGNIWSFVGRAVLFAERGMSKKDFARCTIIEVELLTFGAAAVSLLALPFLSSYFIMPPYLTTLAFVVLGILILLYTFHAKFKLKHFILPDLKPAEILLLLLLNTSMFFSFGLGHFFVFTSFTPIDPNLVWQLTGVAVLAYLVGYLSLLTPSGLGVREGALIFALSKITSVSVAGFIALFSRFILIVAELIFVAISYAWYKTKNKFVIQTEKWIGLHTHEVILFFLFLIYVVYFSSITFLRYDNFYAGRFDLGNMAQTVWNTTQGRIFQLTDSNGTEIVSRLSVHADFILILLAPFYALWSNPKMLLLIQTVVLAAGSFFVFLIGKDILKSKNLGLVFAFLYLINPSIERSNLYDFHAVTLATAFLLATYYFFRKKQYRYFLLFSFLAGITKEQVWLTIALFGVFLFFHHKKRLFGISLFVVCILFSYFLISHAIPNALGSRHFALEYYSEFGNGPIDIIKHIILSPVQTISTIFQPDKIDYLHQLFKPLGYLSFAAPLFLIFAAPDFAINLLSNNSQFHQIYYQYTAIISPFLFIAALYGAFVIKKLAEKKLSTETINLLLIIYLFTLGLYSAYLYGPLPGARGANVDMLTKQLPERAFIENHIAQIDPKLSIAASNNIGSHFSNREKIYVLPIGVDKADVIVFLLTNSEFPDSLETQKKLVEKLRHDPEYKLAVDRDIFVVFEKK